ncbi:MAG: hypothetical protein GOVbin52_36 [Prokaryotic dsDNA virus sp.]|nr:MAG: hypothetical protein GOVbin52_36 [Prokaryotic dsDNA virus sp.]
MCQAKCSLSLFENEETNSGPERASRAFSRPEWDDRAGQEPGHRANGA